MLEFKLPDMTCGHCVGAVTQALKEADPAATVVVDLPQKTAPGASDYNPAPCDRSFSIPKPPA